jgi:hypothetical protein
MIIPTFTVNLLKAQIEDLSIESGHKHQVDDRAEIDEIDGYITELEAVIALLHAVTVFDDTPCTEGCDDCKKYEENTCNEWQ